MSEMLKALLETMMGGQEELRKFSDKAHEDLNEGVELIRATGVICTAQPIDSDCLYTEELDLLHTVRIALAAGYIPDPDHHISKCLLVTAYRLGKEAANVETDSSGLGDSSDSPVGGESGSG
jgi:hypothetical protein